MSAVSRDGRRHRGDRRRSGRRLGAGLARCWVKPGGRKRCPRMTGVHLGRGDCHDGPQTGLAMLTVASIEPHPDQPRRHFDDDALEELARSIAARGVIQPVVVRPHGDGRYQLVAGERRWRAAQRAQLHEIPAIVRQLDDREVTALALIENLQREDLNPVEEHAPISAFPSRTG